MSNVAQKSGVIDWFSEDRGVGMLTSDCGARYSFCAAACSEMHPTRGGRVTFTVAGGRKTPVVNNVHYLATQPDVRRDGGRP